MLPGGIIMPFNWDGEKSKAPGRIGFLVLFVACALLASAQHTGFFAGEASVGSGVYYLQFPAAPQGDGNIFGYYNYTYWPILYHYDLGFEYFQNANDGVNGAYLFDFASGHWWYTSPLEFPYLYDFTFNSWLYYDPNGSDPGHYTSNPRYFYDYAAGEWITLDSTGNTTPASITTMSPLPGRERVPGLFRTGVDHGRGRSQSGNHRRDRL
jgi:hypothetical protein